MGKVDSEFFTKFTTDKAFAHKIKYNCVGSMIARKIVTSEQQRELVQQCIDIAAEVTGESVRCISLGVDVLYKKVCVCERE